MTEDDRKESDSPRDEKSRKVVSGSSFRVLKYFRTQKAHTKDTIRAVYRWLSHTCSVVVLLSAPPCSGASAVGQLGEVRVGLIDSLDRDSGLKLIQSRTVHPRGRPACRRGSSDRVVPRLPARARARHARKWRVARTFV